MLQGTLIAPAAFATGIFSQTVGVSIRLEPSSSASSADWMRLPLLLPHVNSADISLMASFGYPPPLPLLALRQPQSYPPYRQVHARVF
jgi:hypothetical protein